MGRSGRTGARRWLIVAVVAVATLALSACLPVRPRPPRPPAPQAAFAVSTAPMVATFTDHSTGMIKSWSWDFGDGGTSTEQSPAHTYAAHGNYLVTLTVTGPGGSDTATQNVTVLPPAPVASFTVNPPSGTVPLTVLLTSTSTGIIDSQSWDLDGDGVFDDASGPTVTHTINDAGDHIVVLSVTGPGGTSTTSATIPASLPPPPVASFTAIPSSGVAPLSVQFNDTSTGAITTRSWNFGDGGTSTDQSPTHTYVAAGNYLVTLTVTGPGGTNTTSQTITVTPPPPPQPPVVNITAPPDNSSFVRGTAVSFTGVASDAEDGNLSSTISWVSNRDGPLGVGASIQTSNLSVGTHVITAAVTDTSALTASDQITITISPPPASFQPVLQVNPNPPTGTAPLVVTFDACGSTGQNLRFSWDFDGDGVDDAATCRVVHVYGVGTFPASGTVREAIAGGGSHTQTWQVVVSAPSPPGGDCGPGGGRCDPPPPDDCIPPSCDPRL